MISLVPVAEYTVEPLDVFQHSIYISTMKVLQNSLTHLFQAFLFIVYSIQPVLHLPAQMIVVQDVSAQECIIVAKTPDEWRSISADI